MLDDVSYDWSPSCVHPSCLSVWGEYLWDKPGWGELKTRVRTWQTASWVRAGHWGQWTRTDRVNFGLKTRRERWAERGWSCEWVYVGEGEDGLGAVSPASIIRWYDTRWRFDQRGMRQQGSCGSWVDPLRSDAMGFQPTLVLGMKLGAGGAAEAGPSERGRAVAWGKVRRLWSGCQTCRQSRPGATAEPMVTWSRCGFRDYFNYWTCIVLTR